MAPEFSTLLEATWQHLVDLQSRGVQFVNVSPETLKALSQPISPAPKSAPSRLTTTSPSSAPAPRPALAPPTIPAAEGVRSAAHPVPMATERRSPASGSGSPIVSQEPPTLLPVPSSPVLPHSGPSDRAAALEALRARALACQLCPHLVRSRTQVVFGVGHPEASLMFVGEAPGAEEDKRGEPFVGPAGQLLTRILQAMGLSRDQVYIANILKCRPDMPPGAWGNRPPRPEEMDTCKPYLREQIEIIRPKVLVALGATAVTGLLGVRTSLGSVRGRWHDFQGIPLMPTFHPSYLLRAEEGPDRGHAEKRKTWEDMLLVLERLQLPITEKMRGYFLKPPPASGS